jgi:hypothetical protein
LGKTNAFEEYDACAALSMLKCRIFIYLMFVIFRKIGIYETIIKLAIFIKRETGKNVVNIFFLINYSNK